MFWEYVNTCTFVVAVFQPWFHSDTVWQFWFFCFCFCFMSNKYHLSKLMPLNFRAQKTPFFIDDKHTQGNLDNKVKIFHGSISWFMECLWNCISWNALKEKFHSVSLSLFLFFYGAPRKSVEFSSQVTISNFFFT